MLAANDTDNNEQLVDDDILNTFIQQLADDGLDTFNASEPEAHTEEPLNDTVEESDADTPSEEITQLSETELVAETARVFHQQFISLKNRLAEPINELSGITAIELHRFEFATQFDIDITLLEMRQDERAHEEQLMDACKDQYRYWKVYYGLEPENPENISPGLSAQVFITDLETKLEEAHEILNDAFESLDQFDQFPDEYVSAIIYQTTGNEHPSLVEKLQVTHAISDKMKTRINYYSDQICALTNDLQLIQAIKAHIMVSYNTTEIHTDTQENIEEPESEFEQETMPTSENDIKNLLAKLTGRY